MPSFEDCSGRTWVVEVNINTMRRVRQMVDYDLAKALTEEGLAAIAGDPVLLVDVLYCICQPQATTRGVTDEQFGEAMAGDAIEAGATALLDACAEFAPKAQRQPIKRMLESSRKLAAIMSEEAMQKLDSVDLSEVLENFGKKSPG